MDYSYGGYGGEGFSPFGWLKMLGMILAVLWPLIGIISWGVTYRLCKTREGGERFIAAAWFAVGFTLLPLTAFLMPVLMVLSPLIVPSFIWLMTKPRGSL